MNDQLIKLAERRALLVERSAQQRAELAQAYSHWRRPLAWADRGMEAARFIKRNPLILAGAIILTAIKRPHGIMGWVRRGWAIWNIARSVKRKMAR